MISQKLKSLVAALALGLTGNIAPPGVQADGLFPVIARTDFVIRDPKFAKVVEREINKEAFRVKLATIVSLPTAAAKIPAAKITYAPAGELGGTIMMSFEDSKNRLSHTDLVRLYDKVETYVRQRFLGKTREQSEAIIAGKQ